MAKYPAGKFLIAVIEKGSGPKVKKLDMPAGLIVGDVMTHEFMVAQPEGDNEKILSDHPLAIWIELIA